MTNKIQLYSTKEILKKTTLMTELVSQKGTPIYKNSILINTVLMCPPFASKLHEGVQILLDNNIKLPNLESEKLEELKEFWGEEIDNKSSIRNLAQQYPKFYGLDKLNKYFVKKKFKAELASIFLQFYIDSCSVEQEDNKLVKPSNDRIYTDTLAFRDLFLNDLVSVELKGLDIKDSNDCHEQLEKEVNKALEILANKNDDLDKDSKNNELDKEKKGNKKPAQSKVALNKLTAIKEILSEYRKFGVPTSNKNTATSTTTDSENLSNNTQKDLIAKKRLIPTKKDGHNAFVRKSEPGASRATLADDKSHYRHQLNSIEARFVYSESDMSRLPLINMTKFLSYCLEESPLLFVYTWLLFVLSIQGERLLKIKLVNQKESFKENNIQLSLASILSYSILDGATDSSSTDGEPSGYAIIDISLPLNLSEIIIDTNETYPFKNINELFNDKAEKFSRIEPGLKITYARINRSYWIHIAPLIENELMASTLTGSIQSRYRAAINYRCFKLIKINESFQQSIELLHQEIINRTSSSEKLKTMLSNVTYASDIDNRDIGSQSYFDLKKLRKLILNINSDAQSNLKMAIGKDSDKNWVRFLNLQNSQLFLIQQINHVLRAVGKQSSLYTLSEKPFLVGTLAKDKNSTQFRERRLSPENDIAISQLNACKKDYNHFCNFTSCTTQPLEQTNDTAKLFSINWKNELCIQTMSSINFNDVLKAEGINALLPYKKHNAIRHVMATDLSDLITSNFLNNLLGHAIDAIDVFSPYSTSKTNYLSTTKEAINIIMKKLKFQVISS